MSQGTQLLLCVPGKRSLVARAGSDVNSTVLEIWMGNRVTKELHVPKKLHGSIFNDGWCGTGAVWNADESRVAYVPEVTKLQYASTQSNMRTQMPQTHLLQVAVLQFLAALESLDVLASNANSLQLLL